MLKLSQSELLYQQEGVRLGVRGDGRTRLEYRHFTLETGIVSQASGSARLRLGGTDILVGVKVEIGTPLVEAPDQGHVLFSVECCPSASPEFEGRGAEELNSELARTMERVMNNAATFDLRKLGIIEGQQCWVIYVDALVLDSDGNLFDAISIASRAALSNTKVPILRVVPGERAGEHDIEVVDDPNGGARLDVSSVPICVTFATVGGLYIADTTLEEELCMSARLTCAINLKGNICAVKKGGRNGLSASLMCQMLQTAQVIGPQLIEKQDAILRKDDEREHKLGFFAA